MVRQMSFCARIALGMMGLIAFTAVRAGATPYSDAVNLLTPISYYQFNGTIAAGQQADDEGSRNADATYNGGVSAGAGVPYAGIAGGQSLLTTGGGQTATTTDAGLPTGNSSRSIAAWIRTTESATGQYNMMAYYGSAAGDQAIYYMIGMNTDTNNNPNGNGAPIGPISSGNGNFAISQHGDGLGGATVVNDGQWHFVVYTQTAAAGATADFRIYVDGVLDDGGYAANLYGGPLNMGSNTTLGGTFVISSDTGGNQYVGQLAHLAVFGSALSDAQVLGLYQAAFVPEPSSFCLAGIALVGLLKFRRKRGV